MDENVPRQITVGLRLCDVDVLTVQEDGRAGVSDPQVLARATELKRILFTRDDDLLVLACQKQKAGIAFSGRQVSHLERMRPACFRPSLACRLGSNA